MEPPIEPIIPREGEFKSASDLIRFAEWDWGVDQWYHLDALPTPWMIRWGKDYDTPEKRSAVELPDKERPIPPRWMGYLAAGEKDKRTFTGSKVMHSKWGAAPITSSSIAEGLGATQAFYYVAGTEKEREHITTIPVRGHLRAFDLEDFDFKSNDGFYKMRCMGQMGAPQVAGTMATWLELLLNKYHRLTRTPPPRPEVPLDVYRNWTIKDLMSPAFFDRLNKWVHHMETQAWLLADGKIDRISCKAFVSKPEEQVRGHGFIWEVAAEGKLRRVFRQEAEHFVDLEGQRELLTAANYPDIEVVDLMRTSLATGKNPKRLVTIPPNWGSWFEYKKFAVESIRGDVEKGYVEVYDRLPSVPFCASPQSVDRTRPNRPRMITDDSYGDYGSSKNDCTPTILHAKLRFTTLDRIARRLGTLIKKANALNDAATGMTALLVCVLIGVVDLIEAYRQLSVDSMERWASGFTFLDEQNNLKFGVDKRFGFGATLHPLCFCRLSNANVVVFDQKLTKSSVIQLPVQQRWRNICDCRLIIPSSLLWV